MHPYELATMLKERGKEQSIRMNYGSLYTVVDSLTKAGYIEAVDTFREGRRPERTVYALTSAGHAELKDWLSEILRTPAKEYPEFESALSLMPVLPPDEVIALLKERVTALDERITEVRTFMQGMRDSGLRRLFTIESEYHEALLRAEQCWVRALVTEFETGAYEDLQDWRRWYGELLAAQGDD